MRSGSLPDLAGLGARPTPPPYAHGERARTLSGSDTHRTVRRMQIEHRRDTLHQINVNQIHQVTTVSAGGTGGDWHRGPRTSTSGPAARRRESVASSVGAASVRRLLSRAPPARVPPAMLRSYTALCFARACIACTLVPFTALLGGGDGGGGTGAFALAVMHLTAAISAPLGPLLLRRIGPGISLAITHVPIALLLISYAAEAPSAVVFALHVFAGLGLGPYALTMATAAMCTAAALAGGVREEDPRRRALVRRTLRGLRLAQDLGMLVGVVLLGAAVTLSAPTATPTLNPPLMTHNHTEPRWPSPEPNFMDADYIYDEQEEAICGASGCPGAALPTVIPVGALGRHVLAVCWAVLGVLACILGALCRTTPPSAAELATSNTAVLKDRRLHLVMPLALFIGLQQGFIYTSYIRWYAVCVKGWEAAWIALAGVGTLSGVAAVTVSMAAARRGRDGRHGRRGALAGGGAAAHACLLLALLLWRAARTDAALPAVAAAAWGACGALWDTLQVAAVVGSGGIFGNAWRPAWSYITAVRHLGIALACVGRMYVCVNVQLTVLTCSLVLGALCHAGLEYKTRPTPHPRAAATSTAALAVPPHDTGTPA